MKHIKLFEAFCEGDMEDMISIVRHGCDGKYTMPHYGFDYIEIVLDARTEGDEEKLFKQNDSIIQELLKKFDREISEIYSEETGWFKIYLNAKP